MDKRIKELWLTALRNGEYKQTTGALRRIGEDGKTGYCCLGVLCDLYQKEHSEFSSWQRPPELYNTSEFIDQMGESELTLLTLDVARWADLTNDEGSLTCHPQVISPEDGEILPLATLNDRGSSFEQIADLIENMR